MHNSAVRAHFIEADRRGNKSVMMGDCSGSGLIKRANVNTTQKVRKLEFGRLFLTMLLGKNLLFPKSQFIF